MCIFIDFYFFGIINNLFSDQKLFDYLQASDENCQLQADIVSLI